jgi:hypothetical protein
MLCVTSRIGVLKSIVALRSSVTETPLATASYIPFISPAKIPSQATFLLVIGIPVIARTP